MKKRDRGIGLLKRHLAGAAFAAAYLWLAIEAFTPLGVGGIGGGAGRHEAYGVSSVGLGCSRVRTEGDTADPVGASRGERSGEAALEPGDILLGRYRLSPVPSLDPFRSWTHAALYVGGGKIVEADHPSTGVVEKPLGSWMYPEMTWVSYVRVITADEETREKAVAFAREKVGLPYDLNLLSKQREGNSWYCSELIWAAYYNASEGKIDLVKRPDMFGVSPNEIFMHEDTVVIGGHYEKCPDTIFSLAAKLSLICVLLCSAALKPYWNL